MNPIVLYFASGESLYPGAAILMLAILSSPFLQHRWLLRLRNVAVWLALIMIIMACPPFPWTVDVVFVATFLLWYVATNLSVGHSAQRLANALLAAMLIVLSGFELQHRSLPLISGMPSDHLVIIGDSISAGIDPRVPSWPAVLRTMTGIPVKNLSSVGAFTTEGLGMAAKVAAEDRVLLIEIGGNDLIAGLPSSQFGCSLEAILQKVTAPGLHRRHVRITTLTGSHLVWPDSAAACTEVRSLADTEAIFYWCHRRRKRDLGWIAPASRRDAPHGNCGGGRSCSGSEIYLKPRS